MAQLRLYLDLNLYCRSFNDQTQLRMYREARAVDFLRGQHEEEKSHER